MNSLYVDALKQLPKSDIDNAGYLSDLYLRDTTESWNLIREHGLEQSAHKFIDNIEHKPWIELKGIFFPVEIYKGTTKDEQGVERMVEHYEFCNYDYITQKFTYTNGIYDEKHRKEIQIPIDEIDNWNWRGIAW